MHVGDIIKQIVERRGVIHIGANDGEECVLYNKAGFKKVIWFEPIKEIYLKLRKNISFYPNQIAFNMGIHDTLSSAIIHVASNEGQSSSILEFGTHKKLRPDITYIRDEEIMLARIDELFNQEYIKQFNFAVIDVQGVELNVLKSFGELLHKFDYIYTEVNTEESYKGCSLMSEIDEYLKQYNLHKVKYFVDKKWHWGDAFYKRQL